MNKPDPKTEDIIATLRANAQSLRAQGVMHAALFGSRARGNAKPDSDIDIMIELDPDRSMGVYTYVGIVQFIEDLFPIQVDVSNREALKPHVRPTAEQYAVYAF
jgi:uncharacterized protein